MKTINKQYLIPALIMGVIGIYASCNDYHVLIQVIAYALFIIGMCFSINKQQ